MHEFGITQEILRAVLETSEKIGATKVNRVRITVGELTAVVPDSLQFSWEYSTPGTLAEGAVLDITETPGRSECMECGTQFTHDRFDRHCNDCGSFATRQTGGDELRIDDIDVDTPEEDVGAPEEERP
jgi:hydrogenase nickel incorporation protein HypA/HybF